MKPEAIYRCLLPATQALFPADFNTPKARAMLLAIGLQESDFDHRQQLIVGVREWWRSLTGAACGYWQIERIGIRGVMEHHRAGPMLRKVCDILGYPFDLETLWGAIRHNDILAVAIARLILWIHPAPLPGPADTDEGWKQYLLTWRPGKPKPDKWSECYRRAWRIVLDDLGENGGVL
jgi:hypothetical protein